MIAVDYALAYGWSDDAVTELEQSIAEQDLSAALELVAAQEMPEPASQRLVALIALAFAP
jgi:hypothetical protein